jgi:hypothetical protein
MAKAKLKKVVSPRGIAAPYPKLITPDEYEGDHAYKCGLILDPADEGVQAFIDMLKNEAQTAYDAGIADLNAQLADAKGAKIAKLKDTIANMELFLPFAKSYNEDGTEDGRYVVNFKRKAQGQYPDGKAWVHNLPVFDSAKKPISEGVDIWGGSVLRLQTEIMPWFQAGLKKGGVSCRLFAVQVIELESGSAGGSDGFDVEDGYVSDEMPAAQAAPVSQEDAADVEDF